MAVAVVLMVVMLVTCMFMAKKRSQPSSRVAGHLRPRPAAHANKRPEFSSAPALSPGAARANSDPIVGCYQWYNNVPVVIRADHSIVAGSYSGRWRSVDPARQAYQLTWLQPKDTLTVAPNQLSLNGTNSYGIVTTGTRMAGFRGLVGTWRWENGAPVVVYPNGQVATGQITGKLAADQRCAGNLHHYVDGAGRQHHSCGGRLARLWKEQLRHGKFPGCARNPAIRTESPRYCKVERQSEIWHDSF